MAAGRAVYARGWLLVLALSAPVWAQVPPEKMVADAAFEDGKSLFESGQYAQACARFAESQRLDPASSTLLWLGECYEKSGKLASAWSTYREAAALASQQGKTAREQAALERAAAIESRRPRLVLAVTAPIPALVVRLDGVSLHAPLWNTPLPIDEGPHEIEVSAPGRQPVTLRIDVGPGPAIQRHELPLPGGPISPASAASSVASAGSVSPPASAASPATPPSGRAFTLSSTSLLLGGFGLALLAGGAALQFNARDKAQDAIQQRDRARYEDASTQQTIALTALTAGGALLVSGLLVGWYSSSPAPPSAARRWPLLAPLPGGAALIGQGTF